MYPPKLWTKWVLASLWTLHIIFLIAFIGALAYQMLDFDGNHEYIPSLWIVWMVLSGVCLVTEPTEMVLLGYRALEPWLYFISQLLKVTFWSVYLALSANQWSTAGWWRWSVIGAGASYVSYAASLLYGASMLVKWHLWKKQGGNKEEDVVDEETTKFMVELPGETRQPRLPNV